MRRFVILTFLIVIGIPGCLLRNDGDDDTSALAALLWAALNQVDYQWTRPSPPGGFVSTVIHHPSQSNVLFASGDDAGGFYKSTDGGTTWSLLTGVPVDHSTYAFAFDPGNSNIIYAPNHFGRGLLKSSDAGTTWQLLTGGLPVDDSSKKVNDLAIDPSNTSIIYMALSGGLYKSTNGGAQFSLISSPAFTGNTDTDFRALAVRSNSDVFAATEKGRVYKSTDQGATWTELTAAGFVGVSDLEVTGNALYIAFKDGTITKTTTFNGVFTFVNNATAGGDIESGLWTKVKAVSGASAAQDTLYIGTVYKASSVKWGFHVSTDGGTTLTRRVNGLQNASAFDLSVNPSNTNEVLLASVNSGMFKTTDQGLNWSAVSTGIHAHASLALVEDPANPAQILFSSTADLEGTSKLWVTQDAGAAWSEVTFFNDKNVRSLLMPLGDSQTIIAGTSAKGIYRTQSGSGGAWSQVATAAVNFHRLAKDAVDSNVLYAAAYQPDAHADLGAYVSEDGGAGWSKRVGFAVVNVVPRPGVSREALALSSDVFATTDAFQSSLNSLGLAAFAPGQFFFSAAFVPGTASTLLVGSSTGKLYKTTNYSAGGSGVTWSEVGLSVSAVIINDIVALDSLTWYLTCWTGDVQARASSTPGILRTRDGGVTWEFLHDGLYPARLTYRLKQSPRISGRFYVGMWGAGFNRLDD